MQIIHCGISGDVAQTDGQNWSELNLPKHWMQAGEVLSGSSKARPLQRLVFKHEQILEHRNHLIVSAPTNSGKSLVGLMVLLQTISQGKRVLLLEPLRALAREKVDELERIATKLGEILGLKLSVRIATGDYRLENETLFDSPPQGELIVATPERIEALLRNPINQSWLETVGAVCVDEAHLIRSERRGLTLEYLITSFLCLPKPPRIVLLSATMGDVSKAQGWLAPCTVVRFEQRQPPLEKWVISLDASEDANQVTCDWVTKQLNHPESQVLVFVYQTKATQHLAKLLNQKLGGSAIASAYHGQMSQQQREQVRKDFVAGISRVIVTTTALALGINLPATHVLIRDNTFPGVARLECSELIQMMGRAGRGDRPGQAAVLVRARDGWKMSELVEALQTEVLPSLESALGKGIARAGQFRDMPLIAPQIAALLSRWQERGTTLENLETFLQRSLGGQAMVSQVREALRWLESRVLAFHEPISQRYFLTVLGRKATRSVLPLSIAASYAQLIRDLLTLDPEDTLLQGWKALDHLLLLDLLAERPPSLRRFSSKLVQQVESWCEVHPQEAPLLFYKWMRGTEENSRTLEVMGSLGIEPTGAKSGQAWAHQTGCLAMLRTIVVWERSQGARLEEVERKYGLEGLEGIEERWRDELLWLLSGLAKLLDVRTFYYHLRSDCHADFKRIKRVKRQFRQMQLQIYDLQEQIKYCSPLGSMLCAIRRTAPNGVPKVGFQSIRRLEDAGISSPRELAKLNVDDLVQLGVKRKLAEQIRVYVRRRSQ